MPKYQHLTWYILADGTHADPNDVAPGDDGKLRHKNGVLVATHENGTPLSVGRAAVEGGAVAAAAGVTNADKMAAITESGESDPDKALDAAGVTDEPEGPVKPVTTKDVTAEPAKSYKTRESKAK